MRKYIHTDSLSGVKESVRAKIQKGTHVYVHVPVYSCMYVHAHLDGTFEKRVHTYMFLHVYMYVRAPVDGYKCIGLIGQMYRSLLQNIVSFTGLFCKRDL